MEVPKPPVQAEAKKEETKGPAPVTVAKDVPSKEPVKDVPGKEPVKDASKQPKVEAKADAKVVAKADAKVIAPPVPAQEQKQPVAPPAPQAKKEE